MTVNVSDSKSLSSTTNVYRKYRDGTKEHVHEGHNVINDAGLGFFLDAAVGLISNRTIDSFSWGSGAGSAFIHTDADLHAETGSKNIGYINRTGSVLTLACTIGFSEGNTPGVINEWKAYSAGNPNIPVALAYLGTQAKTDSFELEVDDAITLYNSGT